MYMSQDSAVGIATALWAGRSGGWSSSPGRSKIFLFSGAHPASYPMGTGVIPGGKAAGA
jgi:hypothetical protein